MTKRTVIVTGGTKGIGLGIVNAFRDAGWFVLACARSETDAVSNRDHTVKFHKMDVCKAEDHQKAIDMVMQWTGRLDAYVNCAGFSQWKKIEDLEPDFIDQMINVNLKGVLFGCQAAARSLTENGAIINISSLAGKRGSADNTMYCATKFAVNGITQSLAKELGPMGIRVNALCPVYVRTPGVLGALQESTSPTNGKDIETYLEDFTLSQTALKRLPTGVEVGNATVFFASMQSSAITGQCLNIDCGVLPQ